MKKKYLVLLYLFGFAILIFLIFNFGIENIAVNIKKTGWWFIPVIGIWLIVYLLNASAFFVILGKNAKKIGFKRILSITISGFAINYITPFVTLGGEPYRVYILKKYIDTKDAVASVTSFTLMHMLSHLLLWIVAFPIFLSIYFIRLSNIGGMILVVLIFLGGVLYLLFKGSKTGIFTPISKLLLKLPIGKKLKAKLRSVSESILEIDKKISEFYYNRKKDFYGSLFLEFAARIISSLEFYFALHAIGNKVTLIDALLINAVLTLMLNILFFMPLQLGTREGSMYVVMRLLSISSGQAIYIALVNRIREFFWILIGLILMKFDAGAAKDFKKYVWQNDNDGDEHEKRKAQADA